MQPCSREMQGIMGLTTDQQQQQQIQNPQIQVQNPHFDSPTNDDFLDQMLSLPSWPEVLPGNPKSPWADLNPQNPNNGNTTNTHHHHHHQKLFNIPIGETKQRNLTEDPSPENVQQYPFDESALLASRLRQHQISGNSPKTTMMLQQQLLMSRGGAAGAGGGMDRSPGSATGAACFGGEPGLFPLPLTLGSGGDSDSRLLVDRSRDDVTSGDGSVQGLFSGLPGSLARTGQGVNQPHFHHPQPQSGSISNQSYSAPATGMNHAAAVGSAGGGGSGAGAPVRQKVRARRGQATDPHSIAERLRRERIAERMKALQELVPNANKTDKASMLDEIIDYVKFLQLQVKVLSMSRLGGAAAVAPLVADISSEGGGDCIQANGGGGGGGAGRSSNGNQTASSNDSLTVTEHQVAKLMEEDMGSAMQYLQGKGLCLMPISLASAISTATCHSRNHTNTNNHHNSLMAAAAAASNGDGPSSPSMSVLTVQSTMGNGVAETNVKDATSVSKP